MRRKFNLDTVRFFALPALVAARLISAATIAFAAPKLFVTPAGSERVESFIIIDKKTKKNPKVTVLNDDSLQVSIATLVGQALKFPADEKGLPLFLEQLDFIPVHNDGLKKLIPAKLALRAHVSGREFLLEAAISRQEFENGKLITVSFPKSTSDTPVARITSSGKIELRYDASSDRLDIPHGHGEVHFQSPLGIAGDRTLDFSAYGTHQK